MGILLQKSDSLRVSLEYDLGFVASNQMSSVFRNEKVALMNIQLENISCILAYRAINMLRKNDLFHVLRLFAIVSFTHIREKLKCMKKDDF